MKKINKKEFSKLIVISYIILTTVLIVYTLIWSWVFSDSTPLCVILGLVTGIGVTITNGYFRKSEAENLVKLRMKIKKQDMDTSEIDMKIDEVLATNTEVNIL